MGWLKIAPVIEEEFAFEIEGGEERVDWAEDAMKNWRRQEALLRNQGGRLVRSVSNVGTKLANSKRRRKREVGRERVKENR